MAYDLETLKNDFESLKKDFERKSKYMDTKVKIALIGQPGAGKSSLINELTGKDLFEVGVHTDTTTERQTAELEGMIIEDLPGYGTKRFPLDDWVKEFKPENSDVYLFVFEGKLRGSDSDLFERFKNWKKERNHPYFIVRNKMDDLWDKKKTQDELKQDIINDVTDKMGVSGTKVYFTSCRDGSGIDELKKDVIESDIPRILKSKLIAEFKATSKKDLDNKRNVCLDDLDYYAYVGVANGLNPIPGVDASVDIAIILKMFYHIRDVFGLDQQTLAKYEVALPIAKKIFEYASKEGVMFLLKNLGKRFVTKDVLKYIPLLGQAVSAVLGYKMIVAVGESYIDDCYKLATEILEDTSQKLN